jgi:glycosyltransferase involved in cell wall biosynthesis
VVGGSGAIVVHRALETGLADYRVEALSPYWGLMPPALAFRKRKAAAITHTLPELGPWVAHPDSDLIVTFHNYYLDDELMASASPAQRVFYKTVMSAAVRTSLKRARWVTAVSRFTAELVRRRHAPGERLVVIRNGVDTELFSPGERQDDGLVKILFAGNPTRRKGVEHLAELAEALPDTAVMQVTSGLRDSGIDRMDSRLRGNDERKSGNDGRKRGGKFDVIPRRSHEEMSAVYRGADILFFPTRREGFGLVVAEAMACGLPVVATDCSSMPELVDHGKGGFLFAPDDHAQMLDYLLRLARGPAMRAEMGAYNREKVIAEFPLEKMIAGYRELFSA